MHPVTSAVLATLLALSMAVAVDRLVSQRQDATLLADVEEAASAVYSVLDAELHRPEYLAGGLAGLVAYDPVLDGEATGRLDAALEQVFEGAPHLRNVGLAPDNVLRFVHPLEGNESALGLRYADNPAQWPAVERAMTTGESVLAGPVDLVQGGRGLISRTPVFLADGSYWGIVSLVVDLDGLMASVLAATDEQDVAWALRSTAGTPVAGDQALFDDPLVRRDLAVSGGTWQFAVVPVEGSSGIGVPLLVLRVAMAAGVVLLALLVHATSRRRLQLARLSLRDPLTGLPNRRLVEDRLEQAVANAPRRDGGCTVLLVDLDGFKRLNDTAGHAAGDQVLRDTAALLRSCVRAGDTVGRFGGDEFVLVLPATPLEAARAEVTDRLLDALDRTVELDGHVLHLGATIGAAHAPTHGTEPRQVLRAADEALYAGKQAGRGRLVLADTPAP